MTLINTPANFTFNPTLYPSTVGGVSGHGCGGTVCNDIAAEGKYVNSNCMKGGSGYGFTDISPSKITAFPAGYSVIDKYSNDAVVARPGNVVAHWKSLTGGKRTRRRHSFRQIGCKRRGGKRTHRHSKHCGHKRTHKHRHSKHCGHKRSSHKHVHSKYCGHKRSSHKRSSRRHRGGNGQPYSNIPLSYGQTFNTILPPTLSAMANPVPMTAYNRCADVSRSF
jgi:hypothetical protein